MQKKLWSLTISFGMLLLYGCHHAPKKPTLRFSADALKQLQLPAGEKDADENAAYTELRLKHEFEMLRNPVTGTLPDNYHEMELQVARAIPSRYRAVDPNLSQISGIQGTQGTQNQNSYISVGPNNIGGRSRALAFDKRNPLIMLTGGVTGGIFRSTDGGSNWTFVSPVDDIRSVTSIVQDPAHPDTWYCGTGEVFYPYSAQDIAGTFGHGIFKSIDNGVTWTTLASTASANPNAFNGGFDVVHRIAINPLNGDVYAAVHRKIMRSTDGGTNWSTVLVSATNVLSTAIDGLCDVIAAPDGSKIFASITGTNPDSTFVGIWETSNGTNWTRIAGGKTLGVDSVAGWQPQKKWSRAVMAISPTKKLYVLYKNSNDAGSTTPLPEADLFQCDFSTGNPATYTWKNLSSYVPNEPNFTYAGINPYTTQFSGFDMSIYVNPADETYLFIGGTCLHRVNLGATDPALKFRRIGGYGKGFFPDSTNNFLYPNHHPDVHGIYFSPADNTVLYTASDGGIHKTITSLLADTVKWINRDTGLQTLQYQFVNIIPDTTAAFIIGGAQDNGTTVNFNVPTSLDHIKIGGGDGGSVAMSGFNKIGSTWKQYMYFSTVTSSNLSRLNLTWSVSGNNINLTNAKFDDILPTAVQSGKGQWLTLFTLDPDSTEHLYYNFNNRLFRTTSASTVSTTSGWTEITGVAGIVPSTSELTSMAISKRHIGNKYLYFGTNRGKVYRLTNPNTAIATATPDDITPPTMNAKSYVAGISVNPRSPDTVLAVVSNYTVSGSAVNHIFWCGNATSASPTWQVLDGALAPLSSQSCAIVVKNAGVEYYVGTSAGLYSATAVNGNSTAWFNEGTGMMKHAIIRSLNYRQPDNVLVVGTHGNGIFAADLGGAIVIKDDISTGVDVIQNDKRFIRTVYPTVTGTDVYFKAGTLLINSITCRIMGINGQVMYESHRPYADGVLHLGGLPSGNYVLVITSDNNKYRQVTRVSKL